MICWRCRLAFLAAPLGHRGALQGSVLLACQRCLHGLGVDFGLRSFDYPSALAELRSREAFGLSYGSISIDFPCRFREDVCK